MIMSPFVSRRLGSWPEWIIDEANGHIQLVEMSQSAGWKK
jgi:hypothetical protein